MKHMFAIQRRWKLNVFVICGVILYFHFSKTQVHMLSFRFLRYTATDNGERKQAERRFFKSADQSSCSAVMDKKYKKHVWCNNFQKPNVAVMRNHSLVDGYSIPYEPLSSVQNNSTGDFTVVVLVRSRAALLHRLVSHYSCMSAVNKLIVLWNIQTQAPPDLLQLGRGTCYEKLVIKQLSFNHLTLRFQPMPEILTEAVFSVDDDLLIQQSDLCHAFKVWQNHPWGIVGFHRRSFTVSPNDEFHYGARTKEYRLVLTGSSFLHRNYLQVFSKRCPSEIMNEVNSQINCEDIAMNFVVGEYCQCTAGFHVLERKHIHIMKAVAPNLHSRKQHYTGRSTCINNFAKFYKTLPLLPNWCTF